MDHILVVEDEKKLNDIVRDYLVSLGYEVTQSFTGSDAVQQALAGSFSLLVLDLMLPGLDGIEVARSIRAAKNIPFIMLTARDSEADKLLGFEVGADDYMTKPFSVRELGARIRSVLHRYQSGGAGTAGPCYTCKGISVDCARRTVTKNGSPVTLTAAQFDLLALLFSRPGCAFSRKQLIEQLSGYEYEGYERTIDVHIKNIRKQIEKDPAVPEVLLTVWGYGYKAAEEQA